MKLSERAKKLIDGKNFASVATLMPDGSPQVANVWIDRDGDTIILNATNSRQRTKNLKRDPRIAISIFDLTNPYQTVSIRGKVVDISEKGGEEHIDKMAMKYRGAMYAYHDPKNPRVLLRVEATRIHENVRGYQKMPIVPTPSMEQLRGIMSKETGYEIIREIHAERREEAARDES